MRARYGEVSNQFVRGAVAAGLLAALAGRGARESVRTALRGGVAIAAGTAVANSLGTRRYGWALGALGVGAVSLWLLNQKGESDGKKEQV